MQQYTVNHAQSEQTFSIDIDGEDQAYVKYRFVGPDRVDFHTTFVPPSLREHGLAAILVERALDWAEQEEYHIDASCWYAEKKLARRRG